ncbi:MAG: hydroxyethylthiazole kinase [Anaerotignum sp.]|nr:hydroxyethylthiazole kinase [Anaerotignum sp.]
MQEKMKTALRAVRESSPLVQCITNFVTVNDCANIILAAGGSPTMAMDPREVEEAVRGVSALVCNMGAIESMEAMILAGKEANQLHIPVILDPVAAGGTQLRRDVSKDLLKQMQFSVIRGNASEIRYLAGQQTTGSGVDVSLMDAVTEENLSAVVEMTVNLAKKTGSIIAISGVLDVISDGTQTMVLRNGCATMARITGSGCMLTSMIGAFCGAMKEDCFAATCAAMAVMGVAGEMAEALRQQKGTGNVTFRADLIDCIFNMTEEKLAKMVKMELF